MQKCSRRVAIEIKSFKRVVFEVNRIEHTCINLLTIIGLHQTCNKSLQDSSKLEGIKTGPRTFDKHSYKDNTITWKRHNFLW